METSLQFTPSLDEFARISSNGNLLPIYTVISADGETPVSVFQKLRTKKGYSFILESAQRTGEIGRYSFVARNPRALFRADGRTITITEGEKVTTFETESEPLQELEKYIKQFQYVNREELPQFKGGVVGYIGYDAARFFEPESIRKIESDPLGVPDMYFMLATEVVCFDHLTRRLYIISNTEVVEGKTKKAYEQACRNIEGILNDLKVPSELPHIGIQSGTPEINWNCNISREQFCNMVATTKEFILAGDIMQAVLSQRFWEDYTGDPLNLYRMLWMINPSPYMFLVSFGDELTLVGSSPEVHVRSVNGKVEIRPIAGTRKRGKTKEEDEALAKELLADEKERAEHLMLIDLARNDVGRIAVPGSVQVVNPYDIERFSHVMHIVSSVEAQLRPELNCFDVIRATFPAGTVSGAPKIRAMQIVNDLEKGKRGAYAGAVGYFGFDGNHDSCIALRTVVMKDGKAYVQAGAGIVADSTPEGEFEECRNKARGMLIAVARANQIE